VAFGEDYATDAASPKADIRQQDDGALATNAYLAVVFHQLGRAGLRRRKVMGINQGGPKGPFEPRVLQQGGFNTELGNRKARDVGGGGPGAGRTVHRSGGQQGLPSVSAPVVPRSGDVFQED
jgi:hypothetical protein